MNKIEQLLEKYCPDGVEKFSVSDLCNISRGRVMSKDYLTANKGEYPVFSSQTVNNGIIGSITTYDYDGEFLTWTTDGANAGTIFYREGKFSITNVCGLLKPKEETLDIKYLYYILGTVAKSYVNAGMGNPKLMSNAMGKIQIPIPPIEIQQEIVKILDTFTQLEAELEAELEARKKQYEYYRDEMLSFEDENIFTLEDVIFSLKTGLNPRSNFKLNTPDAENYYITVRELGGVDILFLNKTDRVNDEGLRLINNRSNLEAGDILFSGTGTIGKTALVKEKPTNWNIKEGVYVIKPNQAKVISKFLLYYLNSSKVMLQIMNLSSGATVRSVPMSLLKKLQIPVPSLQKQQEIVDVLDKFDALVNDISSGLPAEIKARKQQYEYYREKLLTFKRLEK